MPDPISIVLTFNSSDVVTGIQQVNAELGVMGETANEASGGGMASFIAGNVQMAEGLLAGAAAAGAMIDKVNEMGVASLRASNTLNNLSGGQAASYITSLSTATGGLVDKMTLATDASFLLTRGLASGQDQVSQITHLGAELGIAFGDTAAGGIETFDNALEKVGSKRALYGLGVDVAATMAEFEKLKATMSDEDAWKTALIDNAKNKVAQLGDQFNTTGTSLERLKTGFSDWATSESEHVAQGIEGLIQGFHDLGAAIDEVEAKKKEAAGTTNASMTNQPTTGLYSARYDPALTDPRQFDYPGGHLDLSNNPYYLPYTHGAGDVTSMVSALTGQRNAAQQGIGNTSNLTNGISLDHVNSMSQSDIDAMSSAQARHHQLSGTDSFEGQTKITANLHEQLGALQEIKGAEYAAADAAAKRAEKEDATLAAIKAQTAQQLLGAKSNTLAGSLTGGMDSAEQARESADAKDPKKLAADQAAYKAAQDAIGLATGTQTEATIKLRDIQDDLAASYAKGKISADQYADAEIKLYAAMAGGVKTAQQLTQAQANIALSQGNEVIKKGHGMTGHGLDDVGDAVRGSSQLAVTGDTKTAADQYHVLTEAARTASMDMEAQSFGAMAVSNASKKVDGLATKYDALDGKIVTVTIKQVYTTEGTPVSGVGSVNSAGDRQ